MEAKKLGPFIAERRKELGMTQSNLAEKLHVTDKAVSRWERSVGLPDISIIEDLAEALDVTLVELMQAQRADGENISTVEAEQLLIDTIEMSRTTNKIVKSIGSIILFIFVIISVLLFALLISDGEIVMFSVGSIIAGLVAWGMPIWKITFSKVKKSNYFSMLSFGVALISLMFQFVDIAREVHTRDWAAIEDTIDALVIVVILFVCITLLLNVIAEVKTSKK